MAAMGLDGEPTRIPLVQFWDTGLPPDEVVSLMTSWALDTSFAYEAFDATSAEALISTNLDAATLTAFRQCAVPAMQADLFRYCALLIRGGLYIDADAKNAGTLPDMLSRLASPRGALMTRHDRIANDFIFIQNPGDPLLARTVEIAVDNIGRRISNNVWAVTGPGIFTALYADAETRLLFDGLSILPVTEVRRHVLFRWDLEYKKGAADWRRWSAAGSIFKGNA